MFGHHGFVIQNREEKKKEDDKKEDEDDKEDEEEEENVMRFACVRILKGHRSGMK